MSTPLRGADVLARTLAQVGTRYLFSLSGNHVMPVYDAAIDARLAIVHVRHEGAAVHMADAWGRLTEQAGIALVTGGPGHANAIGALYTAAAAESPLVLLSGHAPLGQLGMDAFQEMRQADVAAPLVKAAWTARSADKLGEDIARALRIACSGRPGPVHVSLPVDVLEERIGATVTPLPTEAFEPDRQLLSASVAAEIATRLGKAHRPLILVGPRLCGQRGLQERNALEGALGVPVLGMESPRGVNDPALGAVAEILREADLVLLLGKKLDFTLRFGRPPAFSAACTFLQVDPEQDSFGRARHALGDPARIPIAALADAGDAAERIAAAATSRGDPGWLAAVQAAVSFRPQEWDRTGSASHAPMHPAEVGRTVAAVLEGKGDSVLVIDGGEFGQWAQACIDAPLRLINGPAGSIGAAIPFALTAKLARPEAAVVALLGDGTCGFHLAEFDTAVRHQLDFVAIVGNDACWNAEHQIQRNTYGPERAVGCELLPTRYDAVAAALGGHGELVQESATLRPAFERALDARKPACVNVMIERLPAPNVSRKTTIS